MCLNNVSNPVSSDEQKRGDMPITDRLRLRDISDHAFEILDEVCKAALGMLNGCSECPMQKFCVEKINASRFAEIHQIMNEACEDEESSFIESLKEDFEELRDKISELQDDAYNLSSGVDVINDLARDFEERLEEVE